MRPTNYAKASNADTVLQVDDTESEDNTETPRPQGMSKDLIELSDKQPYITPSVLERKTQKAVTPPPDDTEAEDSEVEKIQREKAKKVERKASVATVAKKSSNKVR